MHRSFSAVLVINNPSQDGNFYNYYQDENNFIAEDVQIHFLQYPPAAAQLQVGLDQAGPGPLQRLSLGPEVSNNLVTWSEVTALVPPSLVSGPLSRLGYHWLRGPECCWRQQSYAMKNQLVASKAPY